MGQSLYSVVVFLVFSVSACFCGVVFQDSRLYEGSSCDLSDGKTGVCSLNCAANLNPDPSKICGFKGNQVLVCCPSESSYPILEQVCRHRNSFVGNIIISRRKRHLKQSKIWGFEEAHNEPQVQRIHPVVFNEHPHMAALGINRGENVIEWFCGGTLIHESFVLTAAHCITNIGAPDVVRVGEIDLTPTPLMELLGTPKTQFNVISHYIHEGYQPPLYYNDIALLQIAKYSFYGPTPLRPTCVWTSGELPTTNLLMMGYGAPAFSQEHTNKLYQGNLTIVEREECSRSYNEFPDLPKGIVDSQICAHDPKGVLDTCEGDSGGPLQFNANDDFKTPYLVGITSFGVLCLDGNPGVYTKVAAYLEWIEGTIRKATSA